MKTTKENGTLKLVYQIAIIILLSIVTAFLFNIRRKHLWTTVLFAALGTGGAYAIGCVIYLLIIAPEGVGYWNILGSFLKFSGIWRMFVPGFVLALVPTFLTVFGLRIAKSIN